MLGSSGHGVPYHSCKPETELSAEKDIDILKDLRNEAFSLLVRLVRSTRHQSYLPPKHIANILLGPLEPEEPRIERSVLEPEYPAHPSHSLVLMEMGSLISVSTMGPKKPMHI